ncbi:PQQ-dependent sugar dehydrogenase [Sphingobium sp. CR28]|uniref:PQQ-dependent sugar dehydrogenase n=1 Tax=Sphingobium sp. CR28 TaxID=3400272 RepID=UPI003FEE37DE
MNAAFGMGDAPDTYTNSCASCHGTDLSGGRGPSLFNPAFLAERTDEQLHATILNGIPSGGMPGFKGQLDDAQIGRLLAYIRIRGGQLAQAPAAVKDPTDLIIKSKRQTVRIDVVAANIDTPWGEAFLPDGRLLVTERPGKIRIVDPKKKGSTPLTVTGTPTPWVRQDGGFFDIAVAGDKKNPWIYLSYAEVLPGYDKPLPGPGAISKDGPQLPPAMTRIIRGQINAKGQWINQQDIFRGPDSMYTQSVIHYGSRFLVDGKHIFYTLGDRGDMTHSQKLDSPLGKIHRVNLDGSAPADNPFVNTPGAIKTIWSVGNRNAEGLSYDPRTRLLWESEHGPTGGDEINIIEKGKNYGWGVVSKGLQPGITLQSKEGMVDPIRYYTPAIAPSGITFNTGNKYPGWKNNLFLTALAGQKLIRYQIEGRKIVEEEILWDQYGRTRAVIMGPDGLLYVLLQNATGGRVGTGQSTPGMVVRLVPQP